MSAIVAVGGKWFPGPHGGRTSGLVAMVTLVVAVVVICLILERATIRSELARWLEEVFGSTRNDDDRIDERAGDEPEDRA
ncbi:MAG: hypothetical protein ACRDH7_01370 [Actinomycetota bacterium]